MGKKFTYTECAKKSMAKWREKNVEKVKENGKKASAVYYAKNKERKQKENLERYYIKKRLAELLKTDINL